MSDFFSEALLQLNIQAHELPVVLSNLAKFRITKVELIANASDQSLTTISKNIAKDLHSLDQSSNTSDLESIIFRL